MPATDPIEAIRETLNNDAAVTASLATYDFGGPAAAPAIFTTDPIPSDCALPAIVVASEGGDSSFGTRSHRGGTWLYSITVWGDKTRSRALLRTIALAVWKAVHRAALDIDCMTEVGCYCDLPAELTDMDGFPGMRLSGRVDILEQLTV